MKRANVYKAKRRKYSIASSIDKALISLIAVLLAFGLIIIYDSTVVLSQDLYGNPYRFLVLQLSWILAGIVGFYFFYTSDLKLIKKISKPMFGASLVFLFVLAVFGVLPCDINFIFTPCINGANRWFYLNPSPLPTIPVFGVLGFQASEITKLFMILYLSASLERNIRIRQNTVVSFLLIVGLTSFLILLQPNFSTALLIYIIGSAVYVSSGAPLTQKILIDAVAGLLGIIGMVSFAHTRERLLTFFSYGKEDAALSAGYHIKQILIALGSGGLFGLGFGQSRQKFQYLPEVFSDSIFAIVGEELGFFGTALLVILFSALVYKGFLAAKRVDDLYAKMVAVGVTTWIALQFFMNVAAMTKIIPLTGVPLPLISYGGSSLIFVMMGLGILANISKRR